MKADRKATKQKGLVVVKATQVLPLPLPSTRRIPRDRRAPTESCNVQPQPHRKGEALKSGREGDGEVAMPYMRGRAPA